MADLFTSDDVKRLLKNKFVVVLGDSIQRGIYKDLVRFVQVNAMLDEYQLKKKLEDSHCGDAVYEGHQLTNAKTYREVRQFQSEQHLIRFYFLTRCFGEYFHSVLMDLVEGPEPDLIIMNSCLWDVTRYGENSTKQYYINLQKTFHCMTKLLPPHTLILWLTALPVSQEMRGGFLLPDINFLKETLRLDILEANFFAVQVAQDYGIDVLDLHYFFRNKTQWRVADGVHWNAQAHRIMSNIILAHVSKAWGQKLPGRDRKHNQYLSPLDAKRAAQSVESYMAVPAGPLPWQAESDLNKDKEPEKKEESGISFSASDLLDLDMELEQSTKSKEKEEAKKKEMESGISFDADDLLQLDLEISKPKKEEPKEKEDSGISFDASDLFALDEELEKKKETPKSSEISFDPDDLMGLDMDLGLSTKKETKKEDEVETEWLPWADDAPSTKPKSESSSSDRFKPY